MYLVTSGLQQHNRGFAQATGKDTSAKLTWELLEDIKLADVFARPVFSPMLTRKSHKEPLASMLLLLATRIAFKSSVDRRLRLVWRGGRTGTKAGDALPDDIESLLPAAVFRCSCEDAGRGRC